MKSLVPIPIAVGAILLLLHALYPPRKTPRSEQSQGNRVDRASILSRDYYWHLLADDGTVLSPSQREKAVSIVPLVLDWDLFITETIAIISLTTIATATVGLFQPTKKTSEQAVSGNAEQAAH